MEEVRQFLESSTIHGLQYISSTKNLTRIFWILVVFGGFTGAGYLIHASFSNWEQNPITTTIETLPISDITYPNVTVCPPRDSFLNLNYDIIKSGNVQLNKEIRKELLDYAIEIIQEDFYNEVLLNISKLEDPKRFYNWYH